MKTLLLKIIMLLLVVGSGLALPLAARAQDDALYIKLDRDSGIQLGDRLLGRFTLTATSTADLTSVSFQVDGQEQVVITQPPFSVVFDTGYFPAGSHTLSAVGRKADNSTITSNAINVEFLGGFVTVLIALAFVIIFVLGLLLVTLMQSVQLERRLRKMAPGAKRNYGLGGGAVCPRCGRPFPRGVFSLFWIGGRLERCPYCHKWSVVRAATPAQLRAAEEKEKVAAK